MEMVELNGESHIKISNHNIMRPFFMSIVSDANHWMFISSNGGLSAGRKNPEYALFPYYTDDKITESADITGSKTIFQVRNGENISIWEPFSERYTGKYNLARNLYKSIYGNKVTFEEINHDLKLTFRYQWNSGKEFGFIRKAELINNGDNDCLLTVLDGIQNIMPSGVPSDLQRATSNLVDAYKRSELEPDSGMGIFALSAIIVDKAEPSEALKANIAWATGLENPVCLLSSLQLNNFRNKQNINAEQDIKGEKGAYFVCARFLLPSKKEKKWMVVANVNQSHSQIIRLINTLQEDKTIQKAIEKDINSGTESLKKLVAAADGFQSTADKLKDTRHYSNVLFNIMRGGIFDDNYQIKKSDFAIYLSKANKEIAARNQGFISQLTPAFSLSSLKEQLTQTEDAGLIRLCIEYLPLKFSRRHGDPSRPWNYFTINLQNETDGSEILDYEGNWRDLFQNWEALAHSYPEFIEGMIFKFLNATTFDGYNPYRVTKGGFDWETIEPDNPWSYIGYWGDHQIIYLQKFFEIIEKHHPGTLQSLFGREWFVYAAVPYTIKPYDQILKNPKDTIEFDHHWDITLQKRRNELGADGALLTRGNNEIYRVNFLEKILATVLTKMSNFIPETGIWLNTQRPEWNDANNALVGNGVSMVTLYYLHRFLKFFHSALQKTELDEVHLSGEMSGYFLRIKETFDEFNHLLAGPISNKNRKIILDRIGTAASEYRHHIYKNGFSGQKKGIPVDEIKHFTRCALDFIEHSIRSNKRADNLYHAYNLMTVSESEVSCSHLSEMLEGQVAVLSSGYLSPEESLEVLDALKSSALYRHDQNSYILYPNKKLPGFLQKNSIDEADARSSELINKLVADENREIVEQDINGGYHFNGNFKNARDLENALGKMAEGKYKELIAKDRKLLLAIFEKVFDHKSFTGRSGTFYSYEGLGSIYWHMVSKLSLAAQECCLQALEQKAHPSVVSRLFGHFYQIQAGIGVHKSPDLYGAFPTDPYSHTPQHRGAQQPGMTGQVKEDILTRFAELGVFVDNGHILFNPHLLRKDELVRNHHNFEYIDVKGNEKQIILSPGQLAFTYCSVPVVYSLSAVPKIVVNYSNRNAEELTGNQLTFPISRQIFNRTGEIEKVEVSLTQITH